MIQSQDIFPFSGEQECRKKLKRMCGYKSRKSPFMEFLYISFSKGKEFNNEFDDLHSDA